MFDVHQRHDIRLALIKKGVSEYNAYEATRYGHEHFTKWIIHFVDELMGVENLVDALVDDEDEIVVTEADNLAETFGSDTEDFVDKDSAPPFEWEDEEEEDVPPRPLESDGWMSYE